MRELVEKKREEVETPEQKRAVDDILNMMNETAVAHIAADRFDTCGRLQMKNAGTQLMILNRDCINWIEDVL